MRTRTFALSALPLLVAVACSENPTAPSRGMTTMSTLAADRATAPGTPGTPNCHGQTEKFLAQGEVGALPNGIGNVARAVGLTVAEVQAVVDAFCASP